MLERKWWTLIAVCTAVFMLLLDIMIVNVALPNMQRSLHASFTQLQWVIDAYTLSLASLTLSGGALADLLGRKRVFAAGIVLFTAASLLCGFATTPVFLIVARGLQGVGGAIMFATSLALLTQEFHGRERGMAFGIWGGTLGAAGATAPIVGGVLTDSIGWRWIFFVNVPLGAIAILLTLLKVSESRDPRASGIDLRGLATLSGTLFLLVFALLRGNDLGWGSVQIDGLLAGSVVAFLAFLSVERRQERPMMDLRLFRKPAFAGASIVAFAISASMFSILLYLTLYLQNLLGYSPLQGGLRFLPISILSFCTAPLAGRLSGRVAPRLLLGLGMCSIGTGFLLMHGVTPSSGWTTLLAGFLFGGVGIGLVNPALATVSIAVVQRERAGMASGINNTFRQIGIATGIALLGAVFQSRVQTGLGSALAGTPLAHRARALARALAVGSPRRAAQAVPIRLQSTFETAAHRAFVGALNDLFLICAGIAFAGALCGFLLVRRRDFVASH